MYFCGWEYFNVLIRERVRIMQAIYIGNTNYPDGAVAFGVKVLCPLGTKPVKVIHSSRFQAMADAKEVNLQLRDGDYTAVKSRKTNPADQNGVEKTQMLQVWYKAPVNTEPFELAPAVETVGSEEAVNL